MVKTTSSTIKKPDKMKIRLNVGRSTKVFGIIVIVCIIVSQLLSYYSYKNRTVKKDEDYFDQDAFVYFEGAGDEDQERPPVRGDLNASMKHKPTRSKAFAKSTNASTPAQNASPSRDSGTTHLQNLNRSDVDNKRTDPPVMVHATNTVNRHIEPRPAIPKVAQADPCRNVTYTTFQTDSFCLSDDTTVYSKAGFRTLCFVEGTKFMPEDRDCICKPGWFGQGCSVPSVVQDSNYPTEYGVKINKVPRRIVYGFPFSHEFDMLEARMNELGDAVDLYVIVESNYSAFGQPKERMLHQNLQKGFLKSFQHKILYLFLDYFPEKGYEDGWVIDALLRDYLAVGLSKVHNLRDDDIFLLTDADEIPTRESLMYLKINYGYPQPIGFVLRHTYFGFYWSSPLETSHAYGACRIDMLRVVFDWLPYLVRSATNNMDNHGQLNHFKHNHNGRISPWNFGSVEHPAGWHCSWCFTPEGIKYKMLAAHISDRPRWGNFPDKVKMAYIENAIANGAWFDGKTTLTTSHRLTFLYAPQFMKDNPDRFSHLLELPDFRSNKP